MIPEQKRRTLTIFHYIVGGLTLLFSLIPLIHIIVGSTVLWTGFSGADTTTESRILLKAMGAIFMIMGLIAITLGQAMGWATIYAGKMIKQNRRQTFCTVMAAINCAFFPFGTVLGVFTLITLSEGNKDKVPTNTNARSPQ